MLIDLKRIAASICPECSSASIGYLSAFNFSGGRPLQITCPIRECGHNCASISPKANKFRISIYCPYCGSVHTHTIDRDKFWKKDFISFPCPEVGISSLFIGNRTEVEAALNQTLGQYSKLYEEAINGLDDFCDDDFDDDCCDDILYDILDTIHGLRDEGALSCVCGSESVAINTIEKKILLSCPRCRRSKVIEANEKNLAMIMNATAIVLGK